MKQFVIIFSGLLSWNCGEAKEQSTMAAPIASIEEIEKPFAEKDMEPPLEDTFDTPTEAGFSVPSWEKIDKGPIPKKERINQKEPLQSQEEPPLPKPNASPADIVLHVPTSLEDIEENPTMPEQSPKAKLQSLTQEWSEYLAKYVSPSGKVDYRSLSSKKQGLQDLLKSFGEVDIKKIPNKNDQLAYWINLYNLATVVKILEHYPIKSIMDINQGKVWDVKWIQVKNQKLSLNQIEHEIIRPEFKEPKIHFAVNCGAKSCPKLSNQAFFGETLQTRLKDLTSDFLNLKSQNQINAKQLKLSKIFEWFAEDFTPLIAFLNQHQSIKIEKNAKISYLEYDWTLNE